MLERQRFARFELTNEIGELVTTRANVPLRRAGRRDSTARVA